MHSRFDHVAGYQSGAAAVGSHGRDDIRAAAGFDCAGTQHRLNVEPAQVGDQLAACAHVDIEQSQDPDAEKIVKRQRLEFALGAVADERHRTTLRAGQAAGCQRGHGGCPQRGGQRQLAQEFRLAAFHARKCAKGHHCRTAQPAIARVPVDVLETPALPIRHRHQLDDAVRRMAGKPGSFLERRPTQEIGLDASGNALQAGADAERAHQLRCRGCAEETDSCSSSHFFNHDPLLESVDFR
jgi:hypothetical protein